MHKCKKLHKYTTVHVGPVRLLWKEINTFIQQRCIKLIKIDSEDFYIDLEKV